MQGKVLVFDLDGTLFETNGGDYGNSTPIWKRIDKVNELWKNNTIVIQTGRAKRWESLTRLQLKKAGVKYHLLDVGNKVPGDLYIDDKAEKLDFFDG